MPELPLAAVILLVGVDEASAGLKILRGPFVNMTGLVGPHAIGTDLILALEVLHQTLAGIYDRNVVRMADQSALDAHRSTVLPFPACKGLNLR